MVVMLVHLSLGYFFTNFDAVERFLPNNQAVDLFFVLSGFILAYVYAGPGEIRPRGGWWNYHLARFARIYPLYLGTLLSLSMMALVMLHYHRINEDNYHLTDFFRQLFLINSYPVIGTGQTWNYPAWSIGIEYLAYVAIFPLFLKWRPARISAVFSLACIGLLTLAEIYCLHGVKLWQEMQHTLWLGVMRGIVGFGSGCLLHDLFTYHPGCTSFFQRRATFCVGVVLTVIALSGYGWISGWWLLLTWPPLVLSLTSASGWLGRMLSTRVALFFGNISYSLYMLHAVVGKMATATFYRTPNLLPTPWRELFGVAFLLSIVLLAWLSFRFFEMPVRFWLRTSLHRAPVSAGPPSAALTGGESVRHGG